jgi:hypothetical protein
MKTPAQFQHELLELSSVKVKELNDTGRKEYLEKLTQLESEVALDLRSLRVQFQARAVSQLNNTTNKAGKGKSTAEKRLMDEEHSRLDPYQSILDKLREMIKEIG